MRTVNMSEISFLQLQVFLTAARELNFTRTANLCHVTQPTVSRLIDSLETTTGIQLFIRNRSGLTLTPAGRFLHQALSDTLASMEGNWQEAFEIQEGYSSRLTIGIPYGLDVHPFYEIAHRLKKKGELLKIHYRVTPNPYADLSSLLSHESDILITLMHEKELLSSYPELVCEDLFTTPLTAFMKRTNPLSSRRFLTFADLRSQKIIFPKQDTFRGYESMLMKEFAKNHIMPNFSYKVSTFSEGVLNLQDDDEVIILNHLADAQQFDSAVEIPIAGTRSGLIMVTLAADQSNQLIEQYRQTALVYAAAQDYTMDL